MLQSSDTKLKERQKKISDHVRTVSSMSLSSAKEKLPKSREEAVEKLKSMQEPQKIGAELKTVEMGVCC